MKERIAHFKACGHEIGYRCACYEEREDLTVDVVEFMDRQRTGVSRFHRDDEED